MQASRSSRRSSSRTPHRGSPTRSPSARCSSSCESTTSGADAFAELVSVHLDRASTTSQATTRSRGGVAGRCDSRSSSSTRAPPHSLARYHQVVPRCPRASPAAPRARCDQLEHLAPTGRAARRQARSGGRSPRKMSPTDRRAGDRCHRQLRYALEAAFSAAALRADPDLEVDGHRGRGRGASLGGRDRHPSAVAEGRAAGRRREQRPDLARARRGRSCAGWAAGAPRSTVTPTVALDDALDAIDDAPDPSTLQPVVSPPRLDVGRDRHARSSSSVTRQRSVAPVAGRGGAAVTSKSSLPPVTSLELADERAEVMTPLLSVIDGAEPLLAAAEADGDTSSGRRHRSRAPAGVRGGGGAIRRRPPARGCSSARASGASAPPRPTSNASRAPTTGRW